MEDFNGHLAGYGMTTLTRASTLLKATLRSEIPSVPYTLVAPGSYDQLRDADRAMMYIFMKRFRYEYKELPIIHDSRQVLIDCIVFHCGDRKVLFDTHVKMLNLPHRMYVEIAIKTYKAEYKGDWRKLCSDNSVYCGMVAELVGTEALVNGCPPSGKSHRQGMAAGSDRGPHGQP